MLHVWPCKLYQLNRFRKLFNCVLSQFSERYTTFRTCLYSCLYLSYWSKFPGLCCCCFLVLQFPAFLFEINQDMLKEKLIRYVRFCVWKIDVFYFHSFWNIPLMLLRLKKKMTGSFMDQKFREVIKITIYGKCRQTKLIRLIFYPITLSGGFWSIRNSFFLIKGILKLHFCLIYVQQIDM